MFSLLIGTHGMVNIQVTYEIDHVLTTEFYSRNLSSSKVCRLGGSKVIEGNGTLFETTTYVYSYYNRLFLKDL